MINLSIIKDHIPSFAIEDFCMFEMITSLKWEAFCGHLNFEEHKKLTLEMLSKTNEHIVMEFIDVNSFFFEGSGQISGFYIKDMAANGYAKESRYEVGDFENGAIKFYCSDIILQSFKKP